MRWGGKRPQPDRIALEMPVATPYPQGMTRIHPAQASPPGWRESLERSKAEIAAGAAAVPLLPVLDRLRDAAERIEGAKGVTADGEAATPSR